MGADFVGLTALARRQHRAFTAKQAKTFGIGSSTLARHVQRGLVVRLGPTAYAFAGSAITWKTRLMALTLQTGGWASHRSAARLRGLDNFQRITNVEVAVAHGRGSRNAIGVVHQSRAPHLVLPEVVDGILCASAPRVLIDLAAVLPRHRLGRAVDDTRRLQLESATDALLMEAYVLHRRRGRPGMEKLGRVLVDQLGTDVPDSTFEFVAFSLFKDADLPEFAVHVTVLDEEDGSHIAEVDAAWPLEKVAVELDSKRFHLGDQPFERDPRKRARLAAQGWAVIPVTWSMLHDDPTNVIRIIRKTIALRRTSPGTDSL